MIRDLKEKEGAVNIYTGIFSKDFTEKDKMNITESSKNFYTTLSQERTCGELSTSKK